MSELDIHELFHFDGPVPLEQPSEGHALLTPCNEGDSRLMNSSEILRTISPSPDELLAAYDAFDELPGSDALPRLVMIRRAVLARFYTDDLPALEQSALTMTLPVA